MRLLLSVVCAVVLAVCCLASSSWATPLMLSNMETADDLSDWVPVGNISHCPNPCTQNASTVAKLTRVAAHATEGTYSCEIDMPAGEADTGMNRSIWSNNNWSNYNVLEFDVENTTMNVLQVLVELSDTTHGDGWAYRTDVNLALTPGVNHLTIPLTDGMTNNAGTGSVDVSKISTFFFAVSGFSDADHRVLR